MNVAVVNCSAPSYNLGAAKFATWRRSLGDSVTEFSGDPGFLLMGFDLVAASVIFSWDAPKAVAIVCNAKSFGCSVEAGGPGLYALARWFEKETGLRPATSVDPRFDRVRGGGSFKFTFASRGCPRACSFCIVPKLEGTEFSFDPEFEPAPVLCDNNLSELPVGYQEHIIARYVANGVTLKDANSGFEPHAFDEATFSRWEPLLRKAGAFYRFALDETHETDAVKRVMRILAPLNARRKRVYCLIGNEPVEACYARAEAILAGGCEPYVQMLSPLNALSKDEFSVKHDWSVQKGRDFQRFYNARVWRSSKLWEYAPRVDGFRPFAGLESKVWSAA